MFSFSASAFPDLQSLRASKSTSWLAHLARCKRETLRSIERRIFWRIFPFNFTWSPASLSTVVVQIFLLFCQCFLHASNLHIGWHTWEVQEKRAFSIFGGFFLSISAASLSKESFALQWCKFSTCPPFLASGRPVEKISDSCHRIMSWHEQAVFDVTDV